jgi:hypothetical protein
MATAKKTTSKADREKCRVTTPEFRASYPHVFKPSGMNNKPNAPKKYSITMLFPKSVDISSVKAAMKQAVIQSYGEDKSKWPKDLENPITDGDAPKNADKEGYPGHWAIKASSGEDQKPSVVNQNVEPILNPADFYPGCYARASLLAYVWDNEFGRGIGFILDHVQKLRDGKSFSGKPSVEQVFSRVDSVDDDAESTADEEESFL